MDFGLRFDNLINTAKSESEFEIHKFEVQKGNDFINDHCNITQLKIVAMFKETFLVLEMLVCLFYNASLALLL